jgi:hypothetical protein
MVRRGSINRERWALRGAFLALLVSGASAYFSWRSATASEKATAVALRNAEPQLRLEVDDLISPKAGPQTTKAYIRNVGEKPAFRVRAMAEWDVLHATPANEMAYEITSDSVQDVIKPNERMELMWSRPFVLTDDDVASLARGQKFGIRVWCERDDTFGHGRVRDGFSRMYSAKTGKWLMANPATERLGEK